MSRVGGAICTQEEFGISACGGFKQRCSVFLSLWILEKMEKETYRMLSPGIILLFFETYDYSEIQSLFFGTFAYLEDRKAIQMRSNPPYQHVFRKKQLNIVIR